MPVERSLDSDAAEELHAALVQTTHFRVDRGAGELLEDAMGDLQQGEQDRGNGADRPAADDRNGERFLHRCDRGHI